CDALRATPPDARGEVQLTDALNLLAAQQAVYGYVFEGVRYDVGNKLGYLRATVELAADREDLGPEFRDFLTDFVQRRKLLSSEGRCRDSRSTSRSRRNTGSPRTPTRCGASRHRTSCRRHARARPRPPARPAARARHG